jgi:hypothetical protein
LIGSITKDVIAVIHDDAAGEWRFTLTQCGALMHYSPNKAQDAQLWCIKDPLS